MNATSVTAVTAAPATARLNRTEAGLLQAAAADAGRLTCPAAMKPTTHARLLGRFLRDGLVLAPAAADGPHRLTPAGYRAIGLAPPKPSRAAKVSAAPTATPAGIEGAAAPSKKAQVQALLAREQGATLAELIAATGWLPHTTRAALSRIRTGGQALLKAARPDGAVAYRIPAPVVPIAAPARAHKTRRTTLAEAPQAAVATPAAA